MVYIFTRCGVRDPPWWGYSYYYFSRHYQIAVKIKPLYLTQRSRRPNPMSTLAPSTRHFILSRNLM
jgi:hypothetical protein